MDGFFYSPEWGGLFAKELMRYGNFDSSTLSALDAEVFAKAALDYVAKYTGMAKQELCNKLDKASKTGEGADLFVAVAYIFTDMADNRSRVDSRYEASPTVKDILSMYARNYV